MCALECGPKLFGKFVESNRKVFNDIFKNKPPRCHRAHVKQPLSGATEPEPPNKSHLSDAAERLQYSGGFKTQSRRNNKGHLKRCKISTPDWAKAAVITAPPPHIECAARGDKPLGPREKDLRTSEKVPGD